MMWSFWFSEYFQFNSLFNSLNWLRPRLPKEMLVLTRFTAIFVNFVIFTSLVKI